MKLPINTIINRRTNITRHQYEDLDAYRDNITIHEAKKLKQEGLPVKMVLPLWIGLKEDAEWMFPIEPLISISGKNEVVKRSVAKSKYRGSVKERWAQDDYQINIQGAFVHSDIYTYPNQDVADLTFYMKQKTSLYVKNHLFQLLDINQIVIESYNLPFSKGENVQNFTIEAVSDDLFKLFIDTKDVF